MFKNKKAFTLTEMIIVIVIIWVLMAWTTIYLQWSDETRKVIEAQWCATTIWWYINNFIFYSLTSRNLRISASNIISPDIYAIKLADCNSNDLCDSIEFYGDEEKYQTINIYDTCHTSQNNLRIRRGWDEGEKPSNDSIIKINKWFSPKKLSEKNIFYIDDNWATPPPLIWEIIMVLCLDKNCSVTKDVTERVVDWRTQTISLRNCAYYNENRTCKTREWCACYNPEDPTECKSYSTYDPAECTIK
jgi:prepilin-type N-terminal cleavage/methylation domain-containing protein